MNLALKTQVAVILLSLLPSPAIASNVYYFSDDQVQLYTMLIIPTFVLIAYLFFKVGELTNIKKNKRIKTERYQAYKMVKTYCSRLERLNKQYEIEKKKVEKANEVIRSANIRIACLKAGLNNQTPVQPFNFFDDLHSLGQIKTRYKLLSAAYHPDKGGNLHTMQMINNQYTEAFKYH